MQSGFAGENPLLIKTHPDRFRPSLRRGACTRLVGHCAKRPRS
jgi:hypothetical protein